MPRYVNTYVLRKYLCTAARQSFRVIQSNQLPLSEIARLLPGEHVIPADVSSSYAASISVFHGLEEGQTCRALLGSCCVVDHGLSFSSSAAAIGTSWVPKY